ncbi:pumilio 20 [Raphanus sativus]|uniref:Pumilio homolog 19 n=1 Tax=Raphanus sativus TaxID=3726 RepID=A0A9W3D4E5_RAPSA|nr:putative pumilio homolog 19 [Raphanus sativus]KAJ4911034.1 pumilio 20 [Raphanus sativus]
MTTTPRSAAARSSLEQESPMVPPPPPPRRVVNLTEDNRSLINALRSATTTPQETDTFMQSLGNLMTGGASQFRDVISELDAADLRKMASFLTSNSRYFLSIARNKNGSHLLQELLGKTADADTFFFAAFFRSFLEIMTDKEASKVVIQGLRVFSNVMKEALFPHILEHAVYLACDQHGCVSLNLCITVLDDPHFRTFFLHAVVVNAVPFSHHAYGNFVVQHVLDLNDLHCTRDIAVSLRGHCVGLSFQKYGSYIVEKLLNTKESMVVVVEELLECQGDRLMRLARGTYGNFVVYKALRVTQAEVNATADLFRDLVNKLRPFRDLLRGSYSNGIAGILNSVD